MFTLAQVSPSPNSHFPLPLPDFCEDSYASYVNVKYRMTQNFTWNLILHFYDQWQNCKMAIRKLHGNLLYYCHDIEHETGFRKIKIR